jgi:hypothetical protein
MDMRTFLLSLEGSTFIASCLCDRDVVELIGVPASGLLVWLRSAEDDDA